jgi:hypothetical protein
LAKGDDRYEKLLCFLHEASQIFVLGVYVQRRRSVKESVPLACQTGEVNLEVVQFAISCLDDVDDEDSLVDETLGVLQVGSTFGATCLVLSVAAVPVTVTHLIERNASISADDSAAHTIPVAE